MDNPQQFEQQEALSPQPSSKKKYMFITAISIAVIVGAVILVLLMQKEAPPEVSEVTSPEVITQDETADWQIYRNDEFGFETTIGANCYASEHEGGVTFSNDIIIPAEDSGSGKGETLRWNEVSISVFPSVRSFYASGRYVFSLEEFVMQSYGNKIDQEREKIEKTTFGVGAYEGWLVEIFKEVGTTAIMSTVYIEGEDGRVFEIKGPTPSLTSALAEYPKHACNYEQTLSTFRFIESETAIDTSDWQTDRNEQFGFEMKYPGDWDLESIRGYDGLIASISRGRFTGVGIGYFPIEAGQEMLDVVSMNTVIGECGPECPPVPKDKISIRTFGENSFYYVFNNLFEGDYAVMYYVEDSNNNRAIRFHLSDFTRSGKNWTDPEYDVDAEPNHELLKRILSTFRFIESPTGITQLTGFFAVSWGDPPVDSGLPALQQFYLYDDRNRGTKIIITEETQFLGGNGVSYFDRKTVKVTGRFDTDFDSFEAISLEAIE